MEITSPEAMAKFAEDVRLQEQPFTNAATQAFASLYRKEYKRMRAAALESGESTAVLTVTVRCNFTPTARSVEMQSTPAPVLSKPKNEAVRLG